MRMRPRQARLLVHSHVEEALRQLRPEPTPAVTMMSVSPVIRIAKLADVLLWSEILRRHKWLVQGRPKISGRLSAVTGHQDYSS